MKGGNRTGDIGGGAAGCTEGLNSALQSSLLSSTALALMLLLQASAGNAQTVTIENGETVSIPGDHDPADVSRVVVNEGGKLTTNNADIQGSVSGSQAGVIDVKGTAELSGGSISNDTTSWGNALFATGENASISANNLTLRTSGTSNTPGSPSSGAYAHSGATINLTDIIVETTGDYGYAIRTAGNGSHIDATGLEISTIGFLGMGVQAYGDHDPSKQTTVSISESTVSTEGNRAFGAQAARIGAHIDAADTHFQTSGDEAFGIIADRGGTVSVTGGSVTTKGQNAHGIFAAHREPFSGSREGESFIEADGVAVTTHGDHSSGVYARGSKVDLSNVDIVTYGLLSHGVQAEGSTFEESPLAGQPAPATITMNGGSIRVDGENSAAALAGSGSVMEISNSTLASGKGAGIATVDDAAVTIENTTVSAAQAAISASFTKADQQQTIVVKSGSLLTENNGTLLEVTRAGDGVNGKLTLELQEGSISSGDVRDLGADFELGGGTDFIINEGAQWSGFLYGIRSFISKSGSQVEFGAGSEINDGLEGQGSHYVFGEGVKIGGDVTLSDGSTTTGGSIDNPVQVDGDVDVQDQTSVLGGNWEIEGNLNVAGTLSPGNSMGKIIVHENLTLEDTSKTHIEIFFNGDSDKIEVDDTATLNGSLVIIVGDGVNLEDPYTILTAGTINGNFASVGWDRQYYFLADPQLDLAPENDPTEVQVTATRNGVAFASAAIGANEIAVAVALEELDAANSAVNAVLLSTSQDDARQAFASLSGEVHASTIGVLVEDSRFVREAANARLRAASEGIGDGFAGAAEVALSDSFAYWVRAYGTWGEWEGASNSASLNSTHGGFIFGGDALVSKDLRVGLLAGYGHADIDIDERSSTASSDSYTVGLYAGLEWHAAKLRIGGAYSWHDIGSRRTVAIASFRDNLRSNHHASTGQLFGEVGYRIGTHAMYVEPYAGTAHVHIATDHFNEDGGDAALTARSGDHDTTFTTTGARVQMASSLGAVVLRLRGELGWRHAFGDLTPASTLRFGGGSPFGIAGAPVARDALIMGAGFGVEVASGARFELSYDGQTGDDVQQHGVNARFGVRF